MDEIRPEIPAEEHRGGDRPDWAAARPGEELKELPGIVPKVVVDPDYAS